MKTYTFNGQEYFSTREAMQLGQQFPGILWGMTPVVIAGTNLAGEKDFFYPAWFDLDFTLVKDLMGDPFEGVMFKNQNRCTKKLAKPK